MSTLYAVYHPLKTVVPRFVDFYFSNDLRLNKFLKPLVNIGAKHDMKVNNTFVLTGMVVFPPLREQQKIVDFLTILDRRIDVQRKKVEALKKYKRGLLNQIFSAISKGSQRRKLRELVHVSGGKTPSMSNSLYWNGDIVWISSKDMKSSRISGSELKITNLALNEMTLYHPGTLLLVARSGILKHSLPLAILEVDATINQDIKALQVHGCNAFYLYYAILSQEDNIIRTLVKTGTTVQSLMMDSFLNIEIPTPDIDQQQSIIDKLAKLEKYVDVQEKELSLLSQMHPQMQTAFATYLEKFLGKLSTVQIQTFLTSHSAHIANTMEFAKVRYAQKSNAGVIYKNLNTFARANPENVDFIRKYLTLTKCDLFFADKAIFVEGASERLLLPDMIEKCETAGVFGSCKYPLSAQYYALIEIGGAYAHKFIPFIDFLGVPCLILTDLDSVADRVGESGKVVKKSVVVSQGETTSNETIKWWVRRNNGLPECDTSKIDLTEITSMTTANKTRGKCHIVFQTAERGLCGHSLEEAIRNVNRTHYDLGDSISEEDLEFKGKSKTDFALDLICECSGYCVPDYIKSGLKWLNDQRVLE